MSVHVPSRLYRSRSQKMISGVSGGLGEYFDVDPVLIRLLFVVTTFVSGVGLVAYVILWIVVPLEGDADTPRMDALRRDFDDLSSRVRDQLDPRREGRPGGIPDMPPRETVSARGPAAGPMAARFAPGGAGGPTVGATTTGTTTAGAAATGASMADSTTPGSATPGSTTSDSAMLGSAMMGSTASGATAPGAASATTSGAAVPSAATTAGTAHGAIDGEAGDTGSADDDTRPVPPADDARPMAFAGDARPMPTASDDLTLADDRPDPLGPAAAYGNRSADGPERGERDAGREAREFVSEARGYGAEARAYDPASAYDSRSTFDSIPAYDSTSAYDSAPASGYAGSSAPYAAPSSTPDRTQRRQHWAGAILILLGVLFLAQNFGLLWWIQARFIWPLVLVGIGAWLLFGRGRRG